MLLLLFTSFILLVSAEYPPPYEAKCMVGVADVPMKEENKLKPVTINLDDPPEKRWVELAKEYTKEIKELIQTIKDVDSALTGGRLMWFTDRFMGKWDEHLGSPYREEIKSIAAATGINLGEMVFYNMFYEISSLCTAIIAEQEDGTIHHVRNLDFGSLMGWSVKDHMWWIPIRLRALQRFGIFTKNNATLYEAVVFPGFIGFFSAFKPHQFSITLNRRVDLKGGPLGILKWLATGEGKFGNLVVREAMEQANSYAEAKDMLLKTDYTSPGYYMVGGIKSGEGCLITAGLGSTVVTRCLDTSKKNGWYVLQTNYDENPPFFDDRKHPGIACTEKMGRKGISTQNLFNVLNSKPNFNMLTAFSHFMIPSKNFHEAYEMICEKDCWFM